jgi:alpha-N-arabinofuranosidase
MATYPEWDRTVLMHTYEHVDYLSLHHYIGKRGKDTAEYLAMPLGIEKQIGEMISVCDYVKAAKRSKKTMHLSFDEWNVWREPDVEYVPWQTGSPYDWVKFHMEDALVFASAMLAILRNADRVRIACQSLLVNTIPLILTEKGGKAWRNPTYYPFLHVSKYGRGEVLRCVLDSPRYDTADYTDVPLIDTAVVWNEEKDELTVFAVNRGGEPVLLRMDIRDFGGLDFAEHIELRHDRLDAVNTADRPDEVAPRPGGGIAVRDGYAECLLGPWSWNVLRFSQDRKEERGHV